VNSHQAENSIAGAQPRSGQVPLRTWLGFGAMCLGMFMAILDIQVVATSLPDIRAALDVGANQMSWIQTARPVDADIQELARPLVERASLVSAINEAWAMMAVAMALVLLGILISARTRRRQP
jgi:MFS transporter, DHA2 family, multidrug resistance protein